MFGLTQKEKDDEVYNAISRSEPERLRKALARGGNPNITWNNSEHSPLSLAAENYNEHNAAAMIAMLIEAGARVDAVTMHSKRGIAHILAHRGYVNAARIAVTAGADLQAQDSSGNTPLMEALDRKKWDFVEYLLDAVPDYTQLPNRERETPLIKAVRQGAPLRIVKRLLDLPADLNIQARNTRDTALHCAAAAGDAGTLGLLLTNKAVRLMPLNGKNQTPLHLAVHGGHHEAAEALIAAGTDIGWSDGAGKTPVVLAAESGSIRMLMIILSAAKSQKKSFRQSDLDKALLGAAEKGYERQVELLIAEGAQTDAADAKGRTPLMLAAMNGHVDVLHVLVKAGAAVDDQDRQGMTAYDYAVSKKQEKAKEFLGRRREDVRRKAAAGKSAGPAADSARFIKRGEHSLEVREEGGGLSITFNFWTQQAVYRDAETGAALGIQNFADIQRQDAVNEAREQLIALGGQPPETGITSTRTKHALRPRK